MSTSRMLFILWLMFSQVIIPPTISLQSSNSDNFGNEEKQFLEDINKELIPLLTHASELSMVKKHLRSSYEEWLKVTAESFESVNRVRDALLQITEKANYVALTGSAVAIGGGMWGILGAFGAVPTGGVSLLVAGSASAVMLWLGSEFKQYSVSEEMCKVASMFMQASKQYTMKLNENMRFYFETLEKFKNVFNRIRENDSIILLFEKIARSNEFLRDLDLDEETGCKLRNHLLQFIKIDISKIKPSASLPAIFAENIYSKFKNLAELLNSTLNELKNSFKDDPVLYTMIGEGLNDYYNSRLKRDSVELLTTDSSPLILLAEIAESARILKENIVKVHSSINEFLLANKNILVGLNAIQIAGGVYVAKQSIESLRRGSTSIESEEMLSVINKHLELKNKIIQEVEKSFGWKNVINIA